MDELALHILDVAENGIAAGARAILVRIEEDAAANRLHVRIEDDGRGMTQSMRDAAFSPFVTTRRERRVGLGLALLEQTARATGGEVRLESEPGRGTRVDASFTLDHLDLPPLGDLESTLMTLFFGNPGVDFHIDLRGRVGQGGVDSRDLFADGERGGSGYRLLASARRQIRAALQTAGFSPPFELAVRHAGRDKGA
jgi:anti-sigma regulatory factor (Ser/Thr protein kinase)